MNPRVIVQPEARADMIAGRAFFERSRVGLGEEFLVEAFAAINRVSEMPESYGILEDDVRAASVKRFGYYVYYRITDEGINVIAVLHGARDPSEWQRRV